MTLTVLTDHQVNALLETLSLEELESFRALLASALNQFSSGAPGIDGDAFQQGRRGETFHPVTRRRTRVASTSGPDGVACKVETSSDHPREEVPNDAAPNGLLTLLSPSGSPLALLACQTLTPFRTALTSSCLLFKRPTVRTITVFGAGSQAYWHLRLALMLRGPTIRHVNIINHRFSSSASGILKRFTLIPNEVKEREGWDGAKFSVLTPGFVEFARLVKEYVREADVIYCCTPGRKDDEVGIEESGGEAVPAEGLFDGHLLTSHEGRKKGRLICAVGEGRELPDDLVKLATKQHHGAQHRHFHKHADEGGVIIVDTLEGALRQAPELQSAGIGPTQLVELGELVMLHRLKIEESETDSLNTTTTSTSQSSSSIDIDPLTITADPAKRQSSMSTVYSDEGRRRRSTSRTRDGSQSPRSGSASPNRMGSFSLSLRRKSHSSSKDEGKQKQKKEEDGLVRWMRDGTVVYRSVGLGAMDLVVGMRLVEIAKEKGVGTQIQGF